MSTLKGSSGQKSKNTLTARIYANSLINQLKKPTADRDPSHMQNMVARAFLLSIEEARS